jgi:gliding motility-associated-like protein
MKNFTKILILVSLFINVNLYSFKISEGSDIGNGIGSVSFSLDNSICYVEDAYRWFTVIRADAIFPLLSLAPPAPAVSSPIYLCQNTTADPLTATASSGATLIWYGTDATEGTGNPTAPTPSTATVGKTKYYVSQVDGTGESPRAEIVVNVVGDTGGVLKLGCDITSPSPITTTTRVEFDWNNVIGYEGYFYSYSISGGPLEYDFQVAPSSIGIDVPGPGTSVAFTILSVKGLPCVQSVSLTCNSTCDASQKIAPIFPSVPTSYCTSEVTTNLPTSSEDSPAIAGTWSPAKVNTATAGITNYIFTPDSVLFPCALTKTLTITVGPVEPNFTDFSICSGESAPSLSTTSPNGVTGTWTPSSIDNMNSASYEFTPDSGQACAPTNKTINSTVIPSNVISSLKWTVTKAFSNNQVVTVIDPVGTNYLYQLDEGPFQVEPVFEMVSLGMHSITVKDVDGCSELRNANVLVIDYPRFFTPNNDGYNDFWNVFTLAGRSGSKIQIFDRYGKLIKEISPNSSGWNGTYNGRPLPATDYWFVVDYPEDGIIKKFRSHFSLKR